MSPEQREELHEGFEHFRPQGWWRERVAALLDAADRADAEAARADAAEAKVARVEDALRLIDESAELAMDRGRALDDYGYITAAAVASVREDCTSQIRAALADPTEDGEG